MRTDGLALGTRLAKHAPNVHAKVVKASTRIGQAIRDPIKLKLFVEQCRLAECPKLKLEPEPWCGACGCATALKRGCPEKRW